MHSRTLLFITFATVFTLGLLHHFALAFYWYWVYWWFDILVHFLGGLFIGLILLWLHARVGDFYPHLLKLARPYVFVPSLVLIIAVLWEFFEIWGGISIAHPRFYTDTITDLVMGSVGGMSALLALWWMPKSAQ